MPVILTQPNKIELWMTAPWAEAKIRLNSAPSPDAELIRLCGKYEALVSQIEALYEDTDHADGTGLKLITDKMSPLLDQLEELHAQTPGGIHARARVAAICNPGGGFT